VAPVAAGRLRTGPPGDAAVAAELYRNAAAVPDPRLFLALVPAPVGPGRVPGGRHGPGQDAPMPGGAPAAAGGSGRPGTRRSRVRSRLAGLPHLGRRELAAGGGTLRAQPAGPAAPRAGPE